MLEHQKLPQLWGHGTIACASENTGPAPSIMGKHVTGTVEEVAARVVCNVKSPNGTLHFSQTWLHRLFRGVCTFRSGLSESKTCPRWMLVVAYKPKPLVLERYLALTVGVFFCFFGLVVVVVVVVSLMERRVCVLDRCVPAGGGSTEEGVFVDRFLLFQVVRWEERRREGVTAVKASRLLGFMVGE